MCECRDGGAVEWSGVFSGWECDVWCWWSSVRCRMNAPDVSLYSAKGAFWIVLHAYLLVSSIILLYCCLDSWTELRASIIVLAIVEWLYIPFALSSIAHGIILLDILWYGLPRPNDWCANIKSRMLYHNNGGDITANTGKLTRIQNSNLKFMSTIHNTIPIQRSLFKFAALFKILATIQIRNMNSARALTRGWLRHPNSFATIWSTRQIWWVDGGCRMRAWLVMRAIIEYAD